MRAGEVIDDRFEIERVAGSGGMGVVYRARDRAGGVPVALKILRGDLGDGGARRFAREIELLASLHHAAIVRYIGHGSTTDGRPYLVTEWVDGEPLGERIVRCPLTLTESVALAVRVAEALGVAHRLGIVHRDVKPANVMLPDGDVHAAMLLDFGIARIRASREDLTRTGAPLGTPGYMSPEQARGEASVDARADVFSLGCVLFKCVTGRPAFEGDDVLAVLLKVVLEETPRLSALRPDVPAALDDLLARMLAKDPGGRPADGNALGQELALLGDLRGAAPPARGPSHIAITTAERKIMCVVLARPRASAEASADEETRSVMAGAPAIELAPAIDALGGKLRRLADGSLLVTFEATGAAADQALHAARAALLMRRALPDATIAAVAGAGVAAGPAPMGEVIDRAVRSLGAAGAAIRVDELLAALLGSRFDVRRDADGTQLVLEPETSQGGAEAATGSRPMSGRDRETRMLAELAEECFGEPMARAVVVVAPPGTGKSRLAEELVRQVRQRGDASIWRATGDSVGAGSPFAMLADMLRREAGILDGEPLEIRREKLRARLARSLGERDLARGLDFLGDVVGARSAGPEHLQVAAARRDTMLMGDQKRAALESLLAAETAKGPLLIVLDDLQWGDLPTVTFLDGILARLHDRPLLVLGLGRPELDDTFPGLWKQRARVELRLETLARKASEGLARQLLGPGIDAETVKRVAERSGGNPFYLEELARSVAAGAHATDALPETVLAMVQARLERLDTDARRHLRAASVFGQTFWRGGLVPLVGATSDAAISRAVDELIEGGVVTRCPEGRFPGEQELAFRHGLLREAAYSMLTDGDRALGHRLAAEWLEQAGEPDPGVLAEHFDRGGATERASGFYLCAAKGALEGNDLEKSLAMSARGLTCCADGETRADLALTRAEALRYRGLMADAHAAALDALQQSVEGTDRWFAAMSEAAATTTRSAELFALVARLRPTTPTAAVHLSAYTRAASQLIVRGHLAMADELLAKVQSSDPAIQSDPIIVPWIHAVLAFRAGHVGDLGLQLRCTRAAARAFDAIDHVRSSCSVNGMFGSLLKELGQLEKAETVLRDVVETAGRLGLRNQAASASHNLGLVLTRTGRQEAARETEAHAVAEFLAQGQPRMLVAARVYLSEILLTLGEVDAAEVEASAAVEGAPSELPLRHYAVAMLAAVTLARGQLARALELAREAAEGLARGGGRGEGEAFVRLTHVRALVATGALDEARDVASAARNRVLERAESIDEPALRTSFLERVEENASTLALWDTLRRPSPT